MVFIIKIQHCRHFPNLDSRVVAKKSKPHVSACCPAELLDGFPRSLTEFPGQRSPAHIHFPGQFVNGLRLFGVTLEKADYRIHRTRNPATALGQAFRIIQQKLLQQQRSLPVFIKG